MAPAPVAFLGPACSLGRDVIGGKAWSIAQLARLGLPTPPAFVITTHVCREYFAAGRVLPPRADVAVEHAVRLLEHATDRTFGHGPRPLLLAVRSGAAVSMPGMMDTILDLGINDEVIAALSEIDPHFATQTAARFREQFTRAAGHEPPPGAPEQLRAAIAAVLDSWMSDRAVAYRRQRGLDDESGTAVTVQAMVFGNLDKRSGTGVVFSRDPLAGTPGLYGEWLACAQGDDLVSGRADAQPIAALGSTLPRVGEQLRQGAVTLERALRDVQDLEFTVESGRLWFLQTRKAKRTPEARVRHAVALGRAGVISPAEALARIRGADLGFLRGPRLDALARSQASVVAQGKPASPGAAVGLVVTSARACEEATGDVVLARPTTDPEDVLAMSMASAVITELGGSTSHAAVICRELGVPCVVGCGRGNLAGLAGTEVTVDGGGGVVYGGALPFAEASPAHDRDIAQLLDWAQERFRTNPEDLAALLARLGLPAATAPRATRGSAADA
jgi:pyruvate,orthophosphate dikinase